MQPWIAPGDPIQSCLSQIDFFFLMRETVLGVGEGVGVGGGVDTYTAGYSCKAASNIEEKSNI